MENISKQHIAKLVLGYLKDEKCKKAFRYLLESSSYLRGYLRKVKKGKPISTRICGLNLIDIINEYSAIYRIVQERLEATNYFNCTQGKSSLEEQLIYLLNRVQYSPPGSPCSFGTRSSSEKDFSFINTSGNICNDSLCRDRDDNRRDCVDNIEIRTTLSSSLPGNVNRSTESTASTASGKSARMRHEDLELAIELVSQKLLENREFHEKLAENINKEVITLCSSPTDEKQNPLNQELDNVIKTVLQKTEADPLFHRLLTDILDSVEIYHPEDSSQNDSPGDIDGQEEQRPSSQSPKDLVIACSDSDQSKKDPCPPKTTPTKLENPLQIQTSSHLPNTNNLVHQTQQLPSECISNPMCLPEVPPLIPYPSASKDSSLPHFINVTSAVSNCITIPASPLIVHSSQSQGLINTGGLLMVQQPNQNQIKSYQVLGGKPLVNIAPKWTPLNEQDIMSMPTVFISDNQSMMPSIAGQSLATTTMDKKPSIKKAKKKNPPKTSNIPSLVNSPHPNTPSEPKKIKTLLPVSAYNKDSNAPPKMNITITTTTTTTTFEEPFDPRSTANDQIVTTPLTTEAGGKKPTPKSNSSHVRQLDFSTPEKPFPDDQEENTVKETKEINKAVEKVKTKDISSRTKSWDADLRAIAGVPEIPTKTPAKKRKRASSTNNNQSKTVTDEHQTATCNKKKRVKQISSSSSSSSTCSQQETKKMIPANDSENTNVATEASTHEEKKVEVPTPQKIEISESKFNEQEESVDVGIECVVINRDIKPTYKRKCNIDHSKRNVVVEKVVPSPCPTAATSFNNRNSLEVIDDMSPTLVLSPTKLNANKRSIVEVKDNKDDELLETPDETHISKAAPLFNAKRNITPTLETPFKKGQPPPKTPHFLSPVNTTDTPFTKVLKEQLQGLDLTSFPTPKFPLTPDLAVTPFAHDQSPYSRRSTDYSTSSSYYQPSDTEQTKSIEQLLIEEGMRLEKKLETPTKNSEGKESVVPHFSQKEINERRSNFNNIMTGKKNLNLMKTSVEEKLHLTLSSSDDNCSSSDDDESSKVWIDNHTNDTVIQNKVPYSLRSRGTVAEIKKQEDTSKDESKIDTSSEAAGSSKTSHLLQSLEEKRKSVIAKLKQDDLKREKEKLQKSKSKATGNKSVSKKKGATSDSARKNNCAEQKTKNDVESLEEKPNNKQKKLAPANANSKIKVEKLVKPMERRPQAVPSTSMDKVETTDSTEARPEIENASDKNKDVATDSSKDKELKIDKKLEERVNTETSFETEKINDTPKKKVTPPSNSKNGKTNSRPENASENSPKVIASSETLVSVEKDDKESLILKKALLSDLKDICRRSSNPEEEDIPKERVAENPKEGVKDNADLFDSKTEKQQSELDKIIVHSNVRIVMDKQPNSSQIQNEEMKVVNEPNQKVTSTSNKPNKEEAKRKTPDAPNNSTLKELTRKNKNTEKRNCKYSPVDEIVLHLSSDDSFGSLEDSLPGTNRGNKTLQPVEFTSRLLEPFELVQTQLHELSSESDRCKIEDQLRKLHEDTSTNDPEILVKELKERGIHLVPAKSSKKDTGLDKIEAKTVQSKETAKITKSSQVETIAKEKNKKKVQNVTLEEGEIVSDSSDSESKKQTKNSRSTKSSRPLPQRRESKSETSRSKPDHKKRGNSTSSRDKEKGNAKKSSSSKSNSKSVKETKSSSTKITVEKSTSHSSPSCNGKQLTSSHNQNTDEKPLEVDLSLPFDTKVYDTETLHLIHDESRKQSCNKKQYNLELLTKKISANVFIEEINCEVEKEMSFTSFTSTLDIPSTMNVNVLQPRKKAKVEKTDASPLDRLYEKLVKNSSERAPSFNSSPLDSLYSPTKTGLYNRKESSKKSKEEDQNRNASNRKTVKNNKLRGSEGEKKKSVEIPELPDDEIEVIDGVISINTTEKVASPDPNDDLMNYAICGSVRIENDQAELSEKKRKASANVDETHDEKKVRTDNCQELLKKIDVNDFLKKLHGNG